MGAARKTTPCLDCGKDHCAYARAGEECWGEIKVVDIYCIDDEFGRDELEIHGCEGHEDICFGDKYKPQ